MRLDELRILELEGEQFVEDREDSCCWWRVRSEGGPAARDLRAHARRTTKPRHLRDREPTASYDGTGAL
jgi:hypothetical protein